MSVSPFWLAVPVVLIVFGSRKMVDLTKASANEKQWAPLIAATESQYGIPAGMLHRLLKTESAFIGDVITGKRRSPAGALGIAQFMPATARQELGSEAAALNPALAIPGAGRYLAKLKNMTGSWQKAVAAYNWGIGNVQRKGIANAPAETVAYLKKVYYGAA